MSSGLPPFRGTAPSGTNQAYNSGSSSVLSGSDGVARSAGPLGLVQSPTGDALGKALASVKHPSQAFMLHLFL